MSIRRSQLSSCSLWPAMLMLLFLALTAAVESEVYSETRSSEADSGHYVGQNGKDNKKKSDAKYRAKLKANQQKANKEKAKLQKEINKLKAKLKAKNKANQNKNKDKNKGKKNNNADKDAGKDKVDKKVDPAKAEGRLLFNGKNLEGWKSTNFGGEGEVNVRNGMIVMEQGNDMTGVTFAGTDLPTMNYELSLEGIKLKGNDFFCTTTFPVGKSHCALVVGGWGGTLVGLSNIDGLDASENGTNVPITFKPQRWYAVRIRVTKDRIQAWIDGKDVVDYNFKGKKISLRAETELCRPLGICTWRTTGAVRNIRVQALPKE